MKATNIQDLVDGFSARMQRERSETQMTLGKLIASLEAMPEGAEVANLNRPHSYRGYYTDLAFERDEGTRPAADLLATCKSAMGKVFEGYKGGDFVMGALTPVWIANYGDCGVKILSIYPDGTVDTVGDVF